MEGAEREALDALVEVCKGVNGWLSDVSETDPEEIVADGGVTAGMVISQEAREQRRRLRTALQAVFGARRAPARPF